MIKKLKLKFIITNMLLLIVVLVFAFVFIYVQNANLQEEKSVTAMHKIAEQSYTPPQFAFKPEDRKDSEYSHLQTYIIDVDDITNDCYVEGFGTNGVLNEEEKAFITDLLIDIKNEGGNEGLLEEYNLRFYCTKIPRGTRIVLLDKHYEDEILRQLLVSFFFIGLCGIVGFLIISIIVAGIAIKPVEKSIKQQKQLISNISHDMKTPLTVISTNTDILLSHEELFPEEDRKWIKYIKDEASRMSDMIKMMLYLAKSDESNRKTKLTDLNLSNIAYDVALPFESICFENKKELIINIEPDLYIKADEYSLKQLFVILLDNAVKYSNENGRIIFSADAIGDNVVVSVFNTGMPIPKKDIPFIFDRFYRADESRARDEGGSGLGLSIAKEIIENNEGSISVSSDEEHGTTFACIFRHTKEKRMNFHTNQ